MLLKKITLFLFILFTVSTLSAGQNDMTITVLPFINNGDIVYEKLSDYIASYIIFLLKDLPGKEVIPLQHVKHYMIKNNYSLFDLRKPNIISLLTKDLKSDIVIGGNFYEENREVLVSLIFYTFSKDELIMDPRPVPVPLTNADIAALVLNNNFDMFLPVLEEFFKDPMNPAFFTIMSDYPCKLYIDKQDCGDTPLRIPLSEGEHKIRLVHSTSGREEVIHQETINVAAGQLVSRDIKVFTPLSIRSDEKCFVFINGEEKGATPFDEYLYTGRQYEVEVVYYDHADATTQVYYNTITTDGTMHSIYLSSRGSITINSPPPFRGILNNTTFLTLPAAFNNLAPGNYAVRVVLPGISGGNRRTFFKKKFVITPFSHVHLDLGTFDYKKRMDLLFIPSAAQFYNREPVKGAILLSAFIGTAVFTGISGIGWYYYDKKYNEEYELAEDHNDDPENSNYITSLKDKRTLFQNLCITGIISLAGCYLYSLVDGAFTINNIYSRIYSTK